MGSIGRWLVPLFLVVVGVLLLVNAVFLAADASFNLEFRQAHSCIQGNSSQPHTCATLAPCQAECELSWFNGGLGALTLIAGVVMSVVRWSRIRRATTTG